MNQLIFIRAALCLFLMLALPLGGCDDDPPDGDADADSDSDADGDADADADSDGDADADSDGDTDGDGDADFDGDGDFDADGDGDGDRHPRDPVITQCPGPHPPAPAEGVCSFVDGTDGQLLITGTVLTPGEVFRGGKVLIDASGNISCVGCDCDDAEAMRLDCLHGVISPGLINTHDHITYVNNHPYTLTDDGSYLLSDERFEHRHNWRRGSGGHTEVDYESGASRAEILWGEIRMVMGGSTSLNGSGSTPGFMRNLDRSHREGLEVAEVEYSTFPLDDARGTLNVEGCDYGDIETAASIASHYAYTPHVSEGINAAAHNEFLCLREGATDLVQDQSAFIHGIGLTAVDIAEMALDGTDLIWSPRTNVTLYGDTARATLFDNLGVPIALGTDWVVSGSMNMLRELQCADVLNRNYMVHEDGWPHFSDEELWLMATRNAANALGVGDRPEEGDRLGTLAEGMVADVVIFDGTDNADHRAVIDAAPEDVVLVLRRTRVDGGDVLYPLFGDAELVSALPGGDSCDALTVCGDEKEVCVSRETGAEHTLSSLQTANDSQYPLFFCDPPEGEPSCVPYRDAAAPWPDPEVDGSNRYDGESTEDDTDGDGIENELDLCPTVFDPIRPMDGGEQADFDADGVGDACDACPLHPDAEECGLPFPTDLDNDGTADADDLCPRVYDPDQLDRDEDDKGDACDLCPLDANPGDAPCPATIYDIKGDDAGFTVGHRVSLTDVIVTATISNGFFMQMDPDGADFDGAMYSGIFVFTSSAPAVSVGDRLNITTATVSEYNCQVQLGWATIQVAASGVDLPDPVPVSTGEVMSGGTMADAYESVLVAVSDVTVTDAAPEPCVRDGGENEFEVSDGAADEAVRIDDLMFQIDPAPGDGEQLAGITGILATRNCCSKLLPRDIDDVVFGSAGLGSLEPALSYAWQGATSTTFPEPLTISLSRISDAPVTVSMSSSGAGLTVDDIIIPAGTLSVEVPVEGVTASETPYTITAELDGDELTAEVRVLGVADVPVLVDLLPEDGTVPVDGTVEMTVVLDLPAPEDTVIDLSVDGGGSVPATVTVLEEEMEATFIYTAPSGAEVVEISATLDADTEIATIEVIEGVVPGLMLNEVDYDQPGGDETEFIEIYNASSEQISLDGIVVVMVNGNGMSEAHRWELSGSLDGGAYFLLANAAVTVPDGVGSLTINDSSVQNGDPDGLALLDTVFDELIDSLSYGGAMTSVTIDGATYDLDEGDRNTVTDGGDGSLIRWPNGTDTDNAVDDWAASDNPTPGEANAL